jgi:hypothetical protein
MNKRSIIEQITAQGAVAAHLTGRHVESIRNIPVKVAMATPIYMKKDTLRKGDKIAIVDMDESVAFICTVSKTETRGGTKVQVLYLEKPKKVKLED